MHYIQNKILYNLTLNEKARYSQLRPPEIESNHFIYHLKQLMIEKLVNKRTDGTYTLSSSGKAYVDRVSLSSFRLRSQPKIVTSLFVKMPKANIYFTSANINPLLA